MKVVICDHGLKSAIRVYIGWEWYHHPSGVFPSGSVYLVAMSMYGWSRNVAVWKLSSSPSRTCRPMLYVCVPDCQCRSGTMACSGRWTAHSVRGSVFCSRLCMGCQLHLLLWFGCAAYIFVLIGRRVLLTMTLWKLSMNSSGSVSASLDLTIFQPYSFSIFRICMPCSWWRRCQSLLWGDFDTWYGLCRSSPACSVSCSWCSFTYEWSDIAVRGLVDIWLLCDILHCLPASSKS